LYRKYCDCSKRFSQKQISCLCVKRGKGRKFIFYKSLNSKAPNAEITNQIKTWIGLYAVVIWKGRNSYTTLKNSTTWKSVSMSSAKTTLVSYRNIVTLLRSGEQGKRPSGFLKEGLFLDSLKNNQLRVENLSSGSSILTSH
jgi:hypothetical protein